MERTFKITTKSNRTPSCQYPSERRYSASIVIGLSVVFAQLCLYSLLMGGLIVHKMTSTGDPDPQRRLWDKVGRDLHHDLDYHVLVCCGCFLMSLGHLLSCCTGLCAWKRWYVDHNITLFFVAATFSVLTSSLSLFLAALAMVEAGNLTFSLLSNVTLLSLAGVVWSFLSTRVAYKGMRRGYPDDVGRNGRVEVSTVMRGDKNCKAFPPDIISHFPAGDKLARYLPREEEGNLPKAESSSEYRERVGRFLEGSGTGEPDGAEGK